MNEYKVEKTATYKGFQLTILVTVIKWKQVKVLCIVDKVV